MEKLSEKIKKIEMIERRKKNSSDNNQIERTTNPNEIYIEEKCKAQNQLFNHHINFSVNN